MQRCLKYLHCDVIFSQVVILVMLILKMIAFRLRPIPTMSILGELTTTHVKFVYKKAYNIFYNPKYQS